MALWADALGARVTKAELTNRETKKVAHRKPNSPAREVPPTTPAAVPKTVPDAIDSNKLAKGEAKGCERMPQAKRAETREVTAAPMARAKTTTMKRLPISQAQAGATRRELKITIWLFDVLIRRDFDGHSREPPWPQ
jgi:hypothetical protein